MARTSPRQDCPTRLDILFVPGRFVGETMCDSATLAFLADRGAKASYVTSVCNGSLVLAAAGLLDGYRSATHWAARGHLAQFVEVSTERVSASWLRNTTRSRRSDAGSPEKAGRSRRRPRRGRPDFPQAHEPPLLELVATALSGHVTR
ncbi:DJ-1/PfpI family protein [Streptomyces malaysiensis]|uniref:DJ-1/PfpI family protein n=1 Tax=Streptomyces malaysiensis TaxID=92644 RepID=UPI00352B2B02